MQYVRYKNRVYAVGDDRSFFQTQFNTFIFTDNVNKSVGYAGWIDLTNPPSITVVDKHVMESKNTYPVYGVELTIKDIQGFEPQSKTLVPQDYRIIGTNKRAFPVDNFSYLQEFYVGLLQESPNDSILNRVMTDVEARSIVYSTRVNELVKSGVFIQDAIVQYLKETGIRSLTIDEENKLIEIESSNYALSLSNTLLASFQNVRILGNYQLPIDQVQFDPRFNYVKGVAQYQQDNPKKGGYYQWGSAGGKDDKVYDGSGLVSRVSDEFTGTRTGHSLTNAVIKNQFPDQASQYRADGFKNLKPGMVVTSSGHTGICVGTDNNGNPVIAHSAGGDAVSSQDSSGITLTPAAAWDKTFGIVQVAVPPAIMDKNPVGAPPPSMVAMTNMDTFAQTKDPNNVNTNGETKNTNLQGGDGIQAPFDPNDYGVPSPMPFVTNPPPPISNVLSEDVDADTTYNVASSEFVGRQRSRQAQTIADKNPPENTRSKENFYPVFTGVITNIDKKSSVDGYMAVLTLKNPSVFLYSNKSSGRKGGTFPGTTTLQDLKKSGSSIVQMCLQKAGFNSTTNTIELQNDQQDASQSGGAATSGTSSVANAADGGSGAQRMERISVDNKNGMTSSFSGTPDQNYQNAEDQLVKKYQDKITPDNLANLTDNDLTQFGDDTYALDKLKPQSATDFPNVIPSNSKDTLPSNRSGGSGGGGTGSGGISSNYQMSWPKITNREKTLINIMSEGTEVYKGIWEAWSEWQDEKKTGKGGNPIAFDGLTLKECIEAVASATNYEAYFDEEGLFWYRAPQFDVNPYPRTRYWFTTSDGRYIRDLKVKVNYHKVFSGAYVSGSPIIWDTPDGQDIPTRVDAYVEDPQITEMVGWKPMINGDPYYNGSHFGNKYIIDTSGAYYYALSQLDRSHGQFITGKITMLPRPDLVLGHTLYIEFMDLVVYVTRIIHTFVPGNTNRTGTEIHFSYGRRFNDVLAYNNYGHSPVEPRKGMSVIDSISPSDIAISGGYVTSNSMNVIDIPPASNKATTLNNQLPSKSFNFPGDSKGNLNRLPTPQQTQPSSQAQKREPGDVNFIRPFRGGYPITSPFGPRVHPVTGEHKMHKGVDFGLPYGTSVIAAADGSVVIAGVETGYGNVVYVDHGKGFVTRYAHGSHFLASVGQSVRQGDDVMKSGNSGVGTGAHLHFEIRKNGTAVDPLIYV